MKNFFAYTLLTVFILSTSPTSADVRSITEPKTARSLDAKKNAQDLTQLYQEIPDLNDKTALRKYLEKRLKIVTRAQLSPEEVSSPSSISIIDTKNLNQKQASTLSAYEKIYEDSMKKATSNNGPLDSDVALTGDFYELQQNKNTESFLPDFPYVTIKLSDKREILAPAEEHIAYLLTTLNIETTGLIKATEEFVYVSNNEDFPTGFFRILPKYTYSRNKTKRRLDLSLQSVTINGEEHPYKVTEIGDYLYIEPQKPLNLPTGIYTYKFKYLIDRAIWYYNNFDELHWNITASTLKNVVGSANAVITLPTGNEFLAQDAVAHTKKGPNAKRVTITSLNPNALGFADTEALAVGDDIHLSITLDKNTLLPPDLLKKYLWLIQDYGAVVFSLMALIAIWLAYKVSLKQIRQNKDKTRAFIRKTPAIFRLLNINTFDTRSLLSEILDLSAKNVIDIQKNDTQAVLIKKTDNLKNLSRYTRNLIKILFPGAETSLPSTSISKLKLERAFNYLKTKTYREFNFYRFKLNSLYLLFSFTMFLLAIIASSLISVNPLHTFGVIFTCTLLFIPYILLFMASPKRRWLNVIIKIVSALSIVAIAGWLSIYTSQTYTVLNIIIIGLIIYYYRIFSRRSGLLRHKIKETEEYKSYLQKNTELAAKTRDFYTKVPYIYAFGLENKYKDTEVFKLIECFEQPLTPTPKG